MNDEQIREYFENIPVNIVENNFLREPQIEGYQATLAHFENSHDHAIIQIPVGCGKTGLMSILPFRLAQGRVLVITPNLEIRCGVSQSLDITSGECFWRKVGILEDYSQGPFRAELDNEANIHDCRRVHLLF